MANSHDHITDEQVDLIKSSRMFFVATASVGLGGGPDGVGPVNMSPKGGVPLHVLGPNRVAYLDYTGSGNETASHVAAGGPITVMVCSFEQDNAAIVRLYGKGSVADLEDSPISDLLAEHPAEEIKLSTRQVIEIEVERTLTSCGYGVPVMSFVRERVVADRGRRYKERR